MLLTLRTAEPSRPGSTRTRAHDPGSVRTVEIPAGRAHLFHPERDTAAVLLELDPVELGGGAFPGHAPYTASGMMTTALGRLFAAASLAEEDEPRLMEARVSVLASPDGPALFAHLFEPLGYALHAEPVAFDPKQPEMGTSWLYSVSLSGLQRFGEAVSHLRLCLPLFDERWPRVATRAEREQLSSEAKGWLETHPARELLERRVLRLAPRPTFHGERHDAVLAALRESGARRVLDLGCGTGALFGRLLHEPQFEEVVGVEVAQGALAQAAARVVPGGRGRVLHGCLVYRDPRLAGFDAAALVEVIEHLDPPQLAAFEEAVWDAARPATVVLTTPNAEYNTLSEYHRGGRLRHPDHRFEWTRAEFRTWATGVAARHGYTVGFHPVGPEDPRVGPLTQMAVFQRIPGAGDADVRVAENAVLELAEVAGERTVITEYGPVHVRAEEAAAALEVMGQAAVDRGWLMYLPPATPAAVAEPGTDTLEHPSAALAYCRAHGAAGAALEELHTGTRVVAIVCRDASVARRRFPLVREGTGAVYAEAGRPFFATRAAEESFLARLRGALEGGGVWEALGTGWVALEGVIGPGVPLMRDVDRRLQPNPALYWAASGAAWRTLGAAEAALARAVASGVDAVEILDRTRARAGLARAYAAECRRACRPVHVPEALRLAPVRVLASEGAVHARRDPAWHLRTLAYACHAAAVTLRATEQVRIDLGDPGAGARADVAAARWSAGMVIRPVPPPPGGATVPVAPALKCRSDDVLRLAYGPGHTLREHRERLRGPGLRQAGPRAAREWALSIEALERFVRGEPPARVHECIFAAVAVRNGARP